jgi:3'(2'), 5'-bisphosphate nucleotidase
MIALVAGGEPVVGVVLEPATGLCTFAARGGGCFRQDGPEEPRAVCVTATESLVEARLIQSHTNPARGLSLPVERLKPRSVFEKYSAGVKLARVARGEADLYVSTYDAMNDWDLAAGHILVTESGGCVSTLDGRALRYGGPNPAHGGGLLATNGRLHAAAVAGLRP